MDEVKATLIPLVPLKPGEAVPGHPELGLLLEAPPAAVAAGRSPPHALRFETEHGFVTVPAIVIEPKRRVVLASPFGGH